MFFFIWWLSAFTFHTLFITIMFVCGTFCLSERFFSLSFSRYRVQNEYKVIHKHLCQPFPFSFIFFSLFRWDTIIANYVSCVVVFVQVNKRGKKFHFNLFFFHFFLFFLRDENYAKCAHLFIFLLFHLTYAWLSV